MSNPDQKILEHALKLIFDVAGKDVDVKAAYETVAAQRCDHDRRGVRDFERIFKDVESIALSLNECSYDLWSDYSDGQMELQDNPLSLSLLAGGEGCSDDMCASLKARPPAVRLHLVRRHEVLTRKESRVIDRMIADGEGPLAAALVAEVEESNEVAKENASAAQNAGSIIDGCKEATPRVYVGNELGIYEVGGER